ncbi:MAG: hypothetical protein GX427_01495 [Actinomycetales bacterium]|nr:hypothetical protein [Actinomycetales bacterium]
MGFLDKAKAAANELAAKADTAMAGAGISVPGLSGGEADKYFRDLGVLAYLQATGRDAFPAEHDRIMATLRDLESRGQIPSMALKTTPPVAPPPPGQAWGGATPPPAPGYAPPPAPGYAAPPPPGAVVPPAPSAPTAPPPAPEAPRPAAPPPPSWASGNE